MNDEQRAPNEELENSKKKLQSLNQELNNVNAQLQAEVTELEARADHLSNLLNSMDVATLFLDRELCIRYFTPGMKALLDLRDTDVGRRVSHLTEFDGENMARQAERLLRELTPIDAEVVTHEGRRYLRRLLPYRTGADRMDGVVITLIDITECERGDQKIDLAQRFAGSIVDTVREPLLVLTSHLRVKSANKSFYKLFGVGRDQTEGRLLFELGDRQWDIPELRRLLEELLPADKVMEDFLVEREFPRLGWRSMLLNARQVEAADEILLAIEDVTERKSAEVALRRSEERLRRVLETDAIGVVFFDLQGTLVEANDVFLRRTGYSREQVKARALTWRTLTPPEWLDESESQLEEMKVTGRFGPYEKEYFLSDGSRSWMLFAGRDLGDGTIVEFIIDVGERKRVETEREMLARELSHRVKNTFAVVQALARLSDGKQQSTADYRDAFMGRLQAMAGAHNLLLGGRWRGADMGELVGQSLEAHRLDQADAVTTEGQPLALTPKQSLGLALVLHELGTNAAKYGALSRQGGRLRIDWRVEAIDGRRQLRFRWQERDGPEVHPPEREGFGLRLIKEASSYELGGKVELDYAPEGLSCHLIFPVEED